MSLLNQFYGASYDVTDWDRAKKFYGETLGLPLLGAMDEGGWAEYGVQEQAHFAISRADGTTVSRGGGAVVIFSVDDANAAVAELRRRGVKCDDPVPIPGMVTYANFYDPDGNRLQVAGPPPK